MKARKRGNLPETPKAHCARLAFTLLILFVLLPGVAFRAQAATVMCSQFGGVIDGYDPSTAALINSSSTIGIDMNCTIENFPESIGGLPATNINFYFPTHASYYIVFDNVYYTGNMSCNDPTHSNFWIYWVNGSYNNISPSCQQFMVPVDAILKQNPPGQTTATIGAPFAYNLTTPVMGLETDTGFTYDNTPDKTDLNNVVITDDLTKTGAALSLTGPPALSWSGGGQLVSGTDYTFSNSGGLLTFNIAHIPANQQVIIGLPVVLNNSSQNQPGNTFFNTATWHFDKTINGTYMSDLPGETGITPPMTIAAPSLVVTKTGSATLNIGQTGNFTIDVQNTGLSDAWNATVVDLLPHGPSGGMCNVPPNVTSVTLAGSPLTLGTDYSISWNGPTGSPACRLSLTMLSAAARIGPGQTLEVKYSSQLDLNSQNGQLSNIAAASQWFNVNPNNPPPGGILQTYTCAPYPYTGTPGVADCQDIHTLTAQLSGWWFEKVVEDVTSGVSPATTASPGDKLHYTLSFRVVDPVNGAEFRDQLPADFDFSTIVLDPLPAGAVNNSNLSAGLIDIKGLNVAANGTVSIGFTVNLLTNLASGTVVSNQAQLFDSYGKSLAYSDNPYDANGISGQDPTNILITGAPVFRVLKTSQDITSGTSTVNAGDTLRYTVTAKNIGTEDAAGVMLRDQIPANTTYVAGSTTLNGATVADPGAGVSALQNGMLIHSPENATPGYMPADSTNTAGNVATIAFSVIVGKNLVNGASVCNQGFVDGSGIDNTVFPEQPSDNPATPAANDPTCNVIGNVPLVSAVKTVKLAVDNNGNGLVDPGDVLEYTITLTNTGATPATNVVLTDAVPANTTYVANTTTLNGGAVADPSPGVSALANGMGVVSSGLAPPSPPSSGGTLTAGGTGTVTFRVQVNAGVPSGTVISNQGTVTTAQLPPLQTNPALITVGAAQQLSITKSYAVVGGGPPLPGSMVEYTVQATNVGMVPANGAAITDDLGPISAQAAYVDGSATMNGSSGGVAYSASVITANYGTTYGALAPGSTVVLRFRVTLNGTLTSGTTVTNTAQASWNSPAQTATAGVTLTVGAQQGSLSGRVWQDGNFNNIWDGTEPAFAGWAVNVYRDGQLLGTVYTGTDGTYQVAGLAPNAGTTSRYELRFSAPGAGPDTAMLGWGDSPFTNGMQRISNIVLSSDSSLQNLNLPLTPDGVVYNSVLRTPVAGARLTMLNASTNSALPSSCFDDPAQQGQVTPASGYYKFDINFSDPACPSGAQYAISVTLPAAGYGPMPSKIIPPSDAAPPFSVPGCSGSSNDALPSVPYCEAQPTELAPPPSVTAGSPGTRYYLHFILSSGSIPGDSQLFNNHIPVDPTLDTAVAITKTSALANVSRGDMVPYTITIRNTLGGSLQNLSVVDTFPPGFKYVTGSALVDGQKSEPAANSRQLSWNISQLGSNSSHTIKLLMIVGSGVSEGEYTNRAAVFNKLTGAAVSGEAAATVMVVADPDLDCTDVIGKVFDDRNLNGVQDPGEEGLSGVRVITVNGLIAITDEFGRFHITCAVVPDEDLGSNFIMKLDERSLPSGYRLTTENPLVERATRGKMIRFNFGATIHRVVRLDIADGAFEPNACEIRIQWRPRVAQLIGELKKAPSVLRLSYLGDIEPEGLVRKRLRALKKEIAKKWKAANGGYRLTIETEIFWRRGAPVSGAE